MFKHAITCLFVLSITACGTADDAASENADSTPANENTDPATTGQTPSEATRVLIETSLGEITIELDAANAPNTVANFLSYVDDGFYDGSDGNGQTTFHRVISGFMIQGGGIKADGSQKSTKAPIAIESNNGLSNQRGTVAMARTSDPNSATSQFFINHASNTYLDYENAANPGYTVFGEVVSGMETVDAIAAVTTGVNDVPNDTISIEGASRVSE